MELALYRDGFCKQEFKGDFEKTTVHVHPKGRGGGAYKDDGDACHLGLGCKLQIFVLLRVFRMESHHNINLPIQVSLGTVHKEIHKKLL